MPGRLKKTTGGLIRLFWTRAPVEKRNWFPVYAENEVPQPQPPVEFGLVKVKPEPMTLVT